MSANQPTFDPLNLTPDDDWRDMTWADVAYACERIQNRRGDHVVDQNVFGLAGLAPVAEDGMRCLYRSPSYTASVDACLPEGAGRQKRR